MEQISTKQFADRFVTMVLRNREFPKKPLDRRILLLSATLPLRPDRLYSEAELNQELHRWTERFGQGMFMDHVTLRRYLIDDGFIERDPAGVAYQLAVDHADGTDPAIAALDLDALVAEEVRAREARKQRYLRKD